MNNESVAASLKQEPKDHKGVSVKSKVADHTIIAPAKINSGEKAKLSLLDRLSYDWYR